MQINTLRYYKLNQFFPNSCFKFVKSLIFLGSIIQLPIPNLEGYMCHWRPTRLRAGTVDLRIPHPPSPHPSAHIQNNKSHTDCSQKGRKDFTHHICQHNVAIFHFHRWFFITLCNGRSTFMMFKLRTTPFLLEAHMSTGRTWKLPNRKIPKSLPSDLKVTATTIVT